MTSNFRIGYPAASLAACTHNGTAATGYDVTALASINRAKYFQLDTATSDDLYIQYANGVGNHIAIARANLLQANYCDRLIVRHSAYSYVAPSAVSGLKIWLDANRGITKSGTDRVSQWRDQSGSSNDANQGVGANQPKWYAGASGINGNAFIRFTASGSEHMTANTAVSTFSGSDKAFTLAIVFRKTTNTGTQNFFALGNAASTTPVHQIYTNAGSNYATYRRDDGSTSVSTNGGTPNTSVHVATWVFTGTTISAWIDGAQIINAAALNVGTATFDTLGIGAWSSTSILQPFDGDMGEICLYDSALGTTDRQNIEGYLTNKWITAASYTDTSFASATLYGPHAEDYIGTFSAANSSYTVVQEGCSAASTYPQSTHFLGTMFDIGREPTYGQAIVSIPKTKHARERAHMIDLVWDGVTHTNSSSFISTLLQYKDVRPVMLYDPADYCLANFRLLHATLRDCSIKASALSNTISTTFEELV